VRLFVLLHSSLRFVTSGTSLFGSPERLTELGPFEATGAGNCVAVGFNGEAVSVH